MSAGWTDKKLMLAYIWNLEKKLNLNDNFSTGLAAPQNGHAQVLDLKGSLFIVQCSRRELQ